MFAESVVASYFFEGLRRVCGAGMEGFCDVELIEVCFDRVRFFGVVVYGVL